VKKLIQKIHLAGWRLRIFWLIGPLFLALPIQAGTTIPLGAIFREMDPASISARTANVILSIGPKINNVKTATVLSVSTVKNPTTGVVESVLKAYPDPLTAVTAARDTELVSNAIGKVTSVDGKIVDLLPKYTQPGPTILEQAYVEGVTVATYRDISSELAKKAGDVADIFLSRGQDAFTKVMQADPNKIVQLDGITYLDKNTGVLSRWDVMNRENVILRYDSTADKIVVAGCIDCIHSFLPAPDNTVNAVLKVSPSDMKSSGHYLDGVFFDTPRGRELQGMAKTSLNIVQPIALSLAFDYLGSKALTTIETTLTSRSSGSILGMLGGALGFVGWELLSYSGDASAATLDGTIYDVNNTMYSFANSPAMAPPVGSVEDQMSYAVDFAREAIRANNSLLKSNNISVTTKSNPAASGLTPLNGEPLNGEPSMFWIDPAMTLKDRLEVVVNADYPGIQNMDPDILASGLAAIGGILQHGTQDLNGGNPSSNLPKDFFLPLQIGVRTADVKGAFDNPEVVVVKLSERNAMTDTFDKMVAYDFRGNVVNLAPTISSLMAEFNYDSGSLMGGYELFSEFPDMNFDIFDTSNGLGASLDGNGIAPLTADKAAAVLATVKKLGQPYSVISNSNGKPLYYRVTLPPEMGGFQVKIPIL
jgi:hypothetical protein